MFKTRYNARVPAEGTINNQDSLTRQSEYTETTVDYYLKRYSATGLLGDPQRAAEARFEDVSEVMDYQEALNKVIAVKDAFMQLPAEKRREFGDDPNNWIQAEVAKQAEEAAKAAQLLQAKQADEAAKAAQNDGSGETPADQGK